MRGAPWIAVFAVAVPLSAQEVERDEPNRGGEIDLSAQDPEVARQRLHTAEGYEIELFATEKDFPIGNPVTMAFDGRGRLWVATMPSYPQRLPDAEPDDKIIILEDTDGDGRADTHTVFAEGLHVPTGFELGDGGAYVAQQPNLMFVEDTDGDDVADRYKVVLHGFGTEDSHHSISAFTWGPGGGLYFQEGTFHHSQVETPWGPVRLVNAGVFRYKPKRHWLEVFVSYGFANPWGHIFDAWGQNFIADASGGANYFGSALTGSAPYPTKRSRMKVFTSIVRPTAGCEIVSSRHFPPAAQGNFLINNTIGFQGIKQHRMIEQGAGFTSEEVEPLVYSTDINFRPVDLQFGPDGALYVVDWFNPLVGHMQYSLRDERRDHGHGRIWRITYPSRSLLESPDLVEATTAELVRLLQAPEDRLRYRVRRELRDRDRAMVIEELDRWLDTVAATEDGDVGSIEHAELEALWVYQTLNVVDQELLHRVLESPEPRARAAATRVARFWRDRIDDAPAILKARAADDFPRTQLEALLGLSYLPGLESTRVALESVRPEGDYYLDYVLGETVDTLEHYWMPALVAGDLIRELSEPAASFLLSRVDTEVLAALPQHPRVGRALLGRPDATPQQQLVALEGLEDAGFYAADELVESLERADRLAALDARLPVVLGDRLREQSRAALFANSVRLGDLVRQGNHREVREAALGALVEIGEARRLIRRLDTELLDTWLRALPTVSRNRRQMAYDEVERLVGSHNGEAMRTLAAMPEQGSRTFAILADRVTDAQLGAQALAALRVLSDPARIRSGQSNFDWDRVPGLRLLALADDIGSFLDGLTEDEMFAAGTRAVLALGEDLAGRLPSLRKEEELRLALAERGVRFVELRPIPHQMVYDLQEIVVEAGRPVEISFINIDVMPHNVVVSRPGTLVDLGRMADAMAQEDPQLAERRAYIPVRTDVVLFATSMVQPGEQESLTFIAPETPGNYPYSCTFPGHWILMNGNLRVVEAGNVDLRTTDTRRSTPTVTGASSIRRFVEDWTYEQLEPSVRGLGPESPSSDAIERGRSLFAEVGCQRCHTRAGEGGEVGPELDDLAERYDPLELLRHVLDPSALVAEEYETVIVKTLDGRVHTGLVAGASVDEVRLYSNPLEPDQVTTVARADIETLATSALSPMPSGLLTTLEREEVMDLLRYLRTDL
ncbi:MAG: PVC-type heme-binding CxxCH protein [Acidobacteriota bacterium]|nr:PVC-type heme-binding CxxCH protein [Acidobacteriota bacterium]